MKARPLENAEIPKLLAGFTGRTAERNRTLFRLGVATGFRVSELLSLDLRDVSRAGRVVETLHVASGSMKGGRDARSVPMPEPAREALRKHRDALAAQGFIGPDCPLFMGHNGRRLSRQAAGQAIRRAARRAGLGGAVSTHSMRKCFAAAVHRVWLRRLAAGEHCEPIRETCLALGHRSVASTEHYLTRDPTRAISAAAEELGDMIR